MIFCNQRRSTFSFALSKAPSSISIAKTLLAHFLAAIIDCTQVPVPISSTELSHE